MNGKKLTSDEAKELWNWLISKDANPAEVREFIKDHSENAGTA